MGLIATRVTDLKAICDVYKLSTNRKLTLLDCIKSKHTHGRIPKYNLMLHAD